MLDETWPRKHYLISFQPRQSRHVPDWVQNDPDFKKIDSLKSQLYTIKPPDVLNSSSLKNTQFAMQYRSLNQFSLNGRPFIDSTKIKIVIYFNFIYLLEVNVFISLLSISKHYINFIDGRMC